MSKADEIRRIIEESGGKVLHPDWLVSTLPHDAPKVTPGESRLRLKGVSLSDAVLEMRGRKKEE